MYALEKRVLWILAVLYCSGWVLSFVVQEPFETLSQASDPKLRRVIPEQHAPALISNQRNDSNSLDENSFSTERREDPNGLHGEGGDLVAKNTQTSKPRAQGRSKHCPSPGLLINRAKKEDLENLPGIGPALAQRILEQRNALGGFNSAEDLLEVPGIGVKKLNSLRGCVRFEP